MTFMIIVFMFPSAPDPTSKTMNYTVVVVGGTMLLSLGYYYFPKYGGVYWFEGPVSTLEKDQEDEKPRSPATSNESEVDEKASAS